MLQQPAYRESVQMSRCK